MPTSVVRRGNGPATTLPRSERADIDAVTFHPIGAFGELMRLRGRYNRQPIVPSVVVDDIGRGGDRARFAGAGYKTLPGWSYQSLSCISHNGNLDGRLERVGQRRRP